VNVFLGIGHLQKQKLGDDQVRHHVIHRCSEEDNPVHQQARVNIITALASTGLFDHHWYQEIIHKTTISDFATYRRRGTRSSGRLNPLNESQAVNGRASSGRRSRPVRAEGLIAYPAAGAVTAFAPAESPSR
jgi:hypothetical protein